ncbi:hypothetical protein ACROYT_G004761 [Oculina patagonica]
MIALGAKYHARCLAALYNRAREHSKELSSEKRSQVMVHSDALADLISKIENSRTGQPHAAVFKLSDLKKEYCKRLTQHGVTVETQEIHSTRLKETLTEAIPGLTAHSKGRDVLLVFNEEIGTLIADASSEDNDATAMCLRSRENRSYIATHGTEVVCSPPATASNKLSVCSHKEADTRMMVHLADAVSHDSNSRHWCGCVSGCYCCYFRPKGTLGVLWDRKNHKILPAHLFAKALGQSKSKCLSVFHALTGCDTAFFFAGSCTFVFTIRYVFQINDARKYLFTKKGRGLEGLPPTHDALEQHLKRTTYQGEHVWGQATIPMPVLPNPTDWGWTVSKEGQMQPLWVTLPAAAVSCKELVHCGCKKTCSKRCKCVKADLPCTPLCVTVMDSAFATKCILLRKCEII